MIFLWCNLYLLMRQIICIAVIFFFTSSFLFSQSLHDIFISDPSIQAKDSNRLYLEVENSNFFKNNEFMGDFKEGYTAIGYYLHPRISYYAGPGTRLSAGVYLQSFSGEDLYYKVKPTFRIQQKIGKNADIILGELYGNLNHGLMEPVYEFDRYIYDHIEEGLQLIFTSRYISGDLWLDWENFILWKDTDREEGTLGFSGAMHVFKNEQFEVNIPLQGVICHKGGQINSTDLPNESLTNVSSGLRFTCHPSSSIDAITVQGHYIYYNDFSPEVKKKYTEGYGFYPSIIVESKHIDFQSAYWYAYKYIAPRGEPLFLSTSSYRDTVFRAYRNLFINKVSLKKEFGYGITSGVKLDVYYNVDDKDIEYSYGIFILFNRRFFLKAIKRAN